VLVLGVACGGAGDEATPTSDTAAPSDPIAPTVTAPSTGEDPGDLGGRSGGDLVGTWVADASELLAANTANLGGTPGLDCSGTITMTFHPDTFERAGTVTCTVGAMSVAGTAGSTGAWSADGDTLSVSDTVTSGSIDVAGTPMPFPDAWGDGEGTWSVEGEVLQVTFIDPAVGNVTQTYRRG